MQLLLLEDETTKSNKTVTLRQLWYDTPVTESSYVHIIGSFSRLGECIIDNSENLIILHPDYLVPATTLGASIHCMRKAVLGDRVKATSQASPPVLYGKILHELFQEALQA